MRRFSAFMDRKDRENKHNLRVLGKVLERAGFQVGDHLDHHEDPYLYVNKPTGADPLVESLTFGGIRLYTRGTDIVSFRPQNEEKAEPFGLAYLLDVKGMYKDLIREHNTDKIGLDLIRYLVEEVRNFFVVSARIEAKAQDGSGLGKIIQVPAAGTGPAPGIIR